MIDHELSPPQPDACTSPRMQGLLGRLWNWPFETWRAVSLARARRRELAPLARLPDRLIRDAGLDPDKVHEVLNGSWDDLKHGGGPRFPRV